MKPSRDIQRLIEIMAALRAPGTGCPWDIEQTFASIVPYTIEEAYEVADAIGRQDFIDLKEELGDLLLQVVYYAQMATEQDLFSFGDVVEGISKKMIRRHPHVFGDPPIPAAKLDKQWDRIKQEEKAERLVEKTASAKARQTEVQENGYLDGIPVTFPALTRAMKLTSKAAKVGFDWPETTQVLDKIEEELQEIKEELAHGSKERIQDEIGDLLFAVANLARHADIDPEEALRGTNRKFERRFSAIETELRTQGRTLEVASLDEMEAIWVRAKEQEE